MVLKPHPAGREHFVGPMPINEARVDRFGPKRAGTWTCLASDLVALRDAIEGLGFSVCKCAKCMQARSFLQLSPLLSGPRCWRSQLLTAWLMPAGPCMTVAGFGTQALTRRLEPKGVRRVCDLWQGR